jgi:hypothetical protein
VELLQIEIANLKAELARFRRSAEMRHYSPRGFQLVYIGDRRTQPIITCENYSKWYDLFVVTLDSSVETLDFSRLESICHDDTPYVDHAPNPIVIMRLAKLIGYSVDEQSYEMMIGRWELEHTDNPRYPTLEA